MVSHLGVRDPEGLLSAYSERKVRSLERRPVCLNCLCGSENGMEHERRRFVFLSCLFGSERTGV